MGYLYCILYLVKKAANRLENDSSKYLVYLFDQ